jgi:hypothetical protein
MDLKRTIATECNNLSAKQRVRLLSHAIRLLGRQWVDKNDPFTIKDITMHMFTIQRLESGRLTLCLSFRAFLHDNVTGLYPSTITTSGDAWTRPCPAQWLVFKLALMAIELVGKHRHDIHPPYHDIQPGFRSFHDAVRSGDLFAFLTPAAYANVKSLEPWFVMTLASPFSKPTDTLETTNPYANPYKILRALLYNSTPGAAVNGA